MNTLKAINIYLIFLFSANVYSYDFGGFIKKWLEQFNTSNFYSSQNGINGTLSEIETNNTCPYLSTKSVETLPELEFEYGSKGFDVIDAKIVKTGIIERNPDVEFTHIFTMEAIRLQMEGDIFPEIEVTSRMQKAAEILKQCGVAMEEYKLINIHPMQDSNGIDIVRVEKFKNQHYTYANSIPNNNRPTMFFVDDTGEGNDAWAIPLSSGAIRDTTFVSSSVLERDQVRREGNRTTTTLGHLTNRTDFSVVAHELFHLFCNCNHVKGDNPNLMNVDSNDPTLRRGILTEEQCKVMRNSPLVKKMD